MKTTRIVFIGSGGLGAPALPYLASAGIGHITIIDHDDISKINLHRQTIFRDEQAGKNKAQMTAEYLRGLNPDIDVRAVSEKLTPENAHDLCDGFDLIFDGSDNFETKVLLNEISISPHKRQKFLPINLWRLRASKASAAGRPLRF